MEERPVDLHEEYANKTEEMKAKYHAAIVAIAEKQGVDMGVAFDMLKAVARGGNYAEGVDLNVDELTRDYNELAGISEQLYHGTVAPGAE
jgi:chorismate synthase